jgi:hypothetical protein
MHYLVATAICMLPPPCIAFIVFSSSLLDLFNGKISHEFFIGLILIILVSLTPVFYRKYQRISRPGTLRSLPMATTGIRLCCADLSR